MVGEEYAVDPSLALADSSIRVAPKGSAPSMAKFLEYDCPNMSPQRALEKTILFSSQLTYSGPVTPTG